MKTNIQQTVEFEVELHFDYTRMTLHQGLDFDGMEKLIRTAKRKRAKADRPCFIRWRAVLTAYGRQAVRNSLSCAKRHAHVDGEWKVNP